MENIQDKNILWLLAIWERGEILSAYVHDKVNHKTFPVNEGYVKVFHLNSFAICIIWYYLCIPGCPQNQYSERCTFNILISSSLRIHPLQKWLPKHPHTDHHDNKQLIPN